jgi:chromosome partitioning protein
MSPIMRTVAILNQKGGVGKTTVTLGLASAAATAGRRVLVVDLDPQAASSWVLGVDADLTGAGSHDVLRRRSLVDAITPSTWSDLIDVVPASRTLQNLEGGTPTRLAQALGDSRAAAALGSYEAILVDCPPSLGNLTTNALAAARHALIVVEPSSLGLRGIGGVADVIDDVWDNHNPDLELAGVVLNRVPAVSLESDRRIAELGQIVGASAIWKPPIPQRVIINQAIGERRSIHSYGARASEPIAAFDQLWARLRRTVRRQSATGISLSRP